MKGNINSKFHVREKSGVVVEYPQPVPSLIVMNFLRKHFPSKRSFMEAFAGSNSSSSSRNPGGSSSRSSSAAPSNLLRAAINNSSISGANSFDSAMRDILMFQGTPLSSNSSSNLQTLDGAINNTNAMFFISDDTPNAQSTITSVINKQQPTMSASPGQVGGRGYARGKTVASVINNYPSQSLSSDPMNLSLSTGAAAATTAELSSMSGQVGPLQQQQQQQLMRMQGMQTGPRYSLPFTSTATNIQPYMYHPNNQPTANAPSLLQPSSDSYQQASSHPPHQYTISMPPTVASSSSQGSSQSASVLNQQFQHVLATSSTAEGGGISSREAIHLERGVQFFFQSDRSSDNPFKPSVNDLAVRFQMPYQLFNDSLKRCDFPFIHSFLYVCMYVFIRRCVRS